MFVKKHMYGSNNRWIHAWIILDFPVSEAFQKALRVTSLLSQSFIKTFANSRDPGSPENGFMEPKYDLRFKLVIVHPNHPLTRWARIPRAKAPVFVVFSFQLPFVFLLPVDPDESWQTIDLVGFTLWKWKAGT